MVKQELKNLNNNYHLSLHMTLITPLSHYKTYSYLLLFQAYHFFVLIFFFHFFHYYFDNLYFGNVLPFFFYLQIVFLFSKKKIKLKKYYIYIHYLSFYYFPYFVYLIICYIFFSYFAYLINH